jgi:uncharacterized protein (DUF2141 family)
MIKWFFFSLFIFLLMPTLKAQALLQVTLNNIKSAKGKVLLALFNSEKGFPENSKNAFLLREMPAAKGSVKVNFENIPAGTYAIAVFHDVNLDGKLNTNLLGIPKEDYGFSNKARPGFRAPTFQEAAFKINGNANITIEIK